MDFLWLSGAVLLTSFGLFWRAAGTMAISRPNIVSWVFYVQLFLLSFIGINAGMGEVEHYELSRATEDGMLMAYYAVLYSMVAIPSAMLLVQWIFFGGRIREKISNFYSSPLIPLQTQQDRTVLLYVKVCAVISLLATIYVYSVIKTSPFSAALSGADAEEIARLRIIAKQEFGGFVYVRTLLSLLLAPIVSYILYGYLKLYRTRSLFFWFLLSFSVAFLALISSGEKAPVLTYLVSFIILKGIIYGRISRFKILVSFGFVASAITALYLISDFELEFSINSGPIGRVILGQISSLPLMFDIFPKNHGFLWGASFPEWMSRWVFNVEQLRPSTLVALLYHPEKVALGISGTANTLFIGEAWANFGMAGLILSPLLIGVVVQFIHNFLASRPKSPIYVALMVYFMLGLPINSGFMEFLWNPAWLVLVVFAVVGILLRGVLVPAGVTAARP